MTLRNNIAAVRAEVAGYRSAFERAAVATLDPTWMRARAREVAEASLKGIALPSQVGLISRFLAVVFANRFPVKPPIVAGTRLTLQPPDEAVAAIAFDFAGTDLFRAGVSAAPDAAWNIILDWVTSGAKERDGRDSRADGSPKTDLEIAAGIWNILFGSDRTPAREAAAESLLHTGERVQPVAGFPEASRVDNEHPRLLEFARLRQENGEAGLSQDTLNQWLEVVQEAWQTVLFDEVEERLSEALSGASTPKAETQTPA